MAALPAPLPTGPMSEWTTKSSFHEADARAIKAGGQQVHRFIGLSSAGTPQYALLIVVFWSL